MMTDPNALAAKALTQMERTFADPDRLKNSESAMNAFCDAMEGLRALAPRLAELEAEVGRLREAVRRAEAVFTHYAELHAAKPDPVKAQRNFDLAEAMRAALGASHDA